MKKHISSIRTPIVISKFIKIHLLALVIFSLFRLILFFSELSRINETTSIVDIFYAFMMGVRFDFVITNYLLIVPYVFITVASFLNVNHYTILRFFFGLIMLLFSISFLISAVDIPYFNQFFTRITVIAFEWLDTPLFVFRMGLQEPRYYYALLPMLLFLFLFYKKLKKIMFSGETIAQKLSQANIFFAVLFLGIMFLGIRGRLSSKSPIRVGTAYFCNDPFLNQLGLNPTFTLFQSYLYSLKTKNQSIHLMDNQLAMKNVQSYLNFAPIDKNFPLMRSVTFDSNSTPYNVVIIIMESMSAAKMQRHGNSDNLTPFLDSLSQQGYYFENAYSAGIHTFNGIFGTLFSMPSLFSQHPMKSTPIKQYHGIYRTLKEKGYSTSFFTTTDGQFDNMEGFLYANGCEKVIEQKDYPSEEIKSTLGVPDDYMFRFSIPIINELYKDKKPFVTALLTLSDHGPYYVPPYFKPKSKEIKKQIVEYADHSLRVFMELASKQSWFENTIFVFVADHGAAIDCTYEMSLDYNHVPILFYAPKIITPKVFDKMAGQIDIFPTIMALLKIPYNNNTLGVNLLEANRPYIYFNGDNKYGVINKEWFLIVRDDKSKSLFRYQQKDKKNYALEMPEKVAEMEQYGQSNMQTYQYVLDKNMQ